MFKTSSECKINNQTILKEHIDEHYQPTEDEIREYALYIGIDLDKEQELLWLAKEGLMKPLPRGWKACQNENGELYYFNFDTGKSSWDHPYDEIYKARVIQEREKRSSLILVLDTHSKGKNTLSISDLSSEKNVYNVPISGKNETADHQCDSQYTNSESEEELINSEAHSTSDFQKDLDFGIDRQLSARIERGEMDPSKMIPTVEEKGERVKLANLAAEAAERRLSLSKAPSNENLPKEQAEISTLRTRLERSANDEKLELLEENRVSMEKFKVILTTEREREEQTLRDQINVDLQLIDNQLKDELNRETKLLQLRQKNDLNTLKQTLEREKQELQTKLRTDMLADVKLDHENQTNLQIRLLQMKHEFDERLRNVENRYKNEIEDLTRRYEQTKSEKELVEKRLHEKNELCLNLQRLIDQLRAEKFGLERKLHEDISPSKLLDDDNSNLTEDKSTFRAIEENDDGLSDSDSDVIEMRQTLNQLKTLNTTSQSIEFSKTNPFRRTISYENQSMMETGQWSQMINKTYPLAQQSAGGKTNFWQSQPSLITREAVLKAARDVLPPGVIDHLTSKH